MPTRDGAERSASPILEAAPARAVWPAVRTA